MITPELTHLTTYTGTKTIQATKCSLDDAQKLLDRKITPADGKSTEGYLVKYPDGYLAWSPKGAFEAAYRKSETYIDRLRIEAEQLRERVVKATAWLYSEEAYKRGNEESAELLSLQLGHMREYLEILLQRIACEGR